MTDRAMIEQTARRQAVAEALRAVQDAARFQEDRDARMAFRRALEHLNRVLGPAEREGDGLNENNAVGMRRVATRLGELRSSPASVQRSDARDFGTAANVWQRLVAAEKVDYDEAQRQRLDELVESIAGSRAGLSFPAKWYDAATEGALYPDLLGRAWRDGRIRGVKVGKRNHYELGSVCAAYPDYRARLEDAAGAEHNANQREPTRTSR